MQPTIESSPKIINIAAALPHDYSRPYVQWRTLAGIQKIVIHWPADAGGAGYAHYSDRLATLARYHMGKNWAAAGQPPAYGFALMYHRVVAPDGAIYLTNPPELVTWHAHSRANEQAIAIMVDVPLGGQPTVAQAKALHAYLEQLTMHSPAIPASVHDVYGHREMPNNATTCPGAVFALVEDWRKNHV